ncbi:MAG TPA: hypothetical protein VLI90_02285, partial [Tepidisphaeraceae bacterium]|nr:hypothetical protein [Tepidisphaeraceae bacterium]
LAIAGRTFAAAESAAVDPTPLGDLFSSRVDGIALRPPAGGTLVRQVNSDDIVRFVYPDRNWDLRLKKVHLAKPTPLSFEPTGNLGGGLLQMEADQLKASNPSADVLVQEVRDVGPTKVGFIAARYNVGVDRALAQQAIVRSDDNQTFYVLQFVTPGQAQNAEGIDPQEAAAKSAFDAVLPTIKLLDRGVLKEEQDQRLFRTRELFATWDERRIKSALIPDQYLRVLRDGKDAGYLHVTERMAEHGGHEGVEIGLQSHLEGDLKPAATDAPVAATASASAGEVVPAAVPAAPSPMLPARPPRIDRFAKLFVTFDRMHEDWSIETNSDDGRTGPVRTSELGNSDKEIHHKLDRQAMAADEVVDPKDKKQPAVRTTEKYTLSVSSYQKVATGAPVKRELPVFYLPQALGHLLPRLLPLGEAQTYMFASYINDQREVMARYVDVGREQDVVLDGQHVRAVPVLDRIGVQGAATTHYLTRDGQWLGSVNETSKVSVLPADEAEIKRLWKDAQGGAGIDKKVP